MNTTILVLIGGLGVLLVGVGLLGTLLGVRAALASFGNMETGFIMAGYYLGYIVGTLVAPRMVRNVGHIRCFAAFAALTTAASLGFGLLVNPSAWFLLRLVSGASVAGIYLVVESWLNEQTQGSIRGRIFALYMMSTLVALAAGQFLLLAHDPEGLFLFTLAAILIVLGLVPIALTRVHEPRIEVSAPVGLGRLYRSSPLGAVGSFAAGVVNGAFWGMAPLFGQRLGFDTTEIATLMTSTILGGVLLQWPIGHLSDLIDRRSVLVTVSLATAGVAAAAGLIVLDHRPGLFIAAFLYGGLMFSIYGLSVAHANDVRDQSEILEATRGLLLVFGVGAFCGPLLGGRVMNALGPAGLPAVSAVTLTLLTLFGLYRMTRRAAPPVDEQTQFVPMVRTSPVVLEMHPDADPTPEPEAEAA